MSTRKDAILERLAKLSNNGKAPKVQTGDSEKKESIYAKFDYKGKNEFLFLPYKSTVTETEPEGDIFMAWNFHKNLTDNPKKEIHAMSNFLEIGEKNLCPINKAIVELKKDFMGNKSIWKPIEEQTKFMVPVIDLNDVEGGVKWFSYKVSVKKQLENEISNMEDDETLFWDLSAPKKVIITFDGDAPAATMYAVSFKEIKDKELLKTIKASKNDWIEQCVDPKQLMKNYWDLQKRQELIEGYLDRVEGAASNKKEEIEDSLDSLVDDDE
jgi:hypothetical protein